ncbi:MAG: sodium:proton antiporter [Phycisphaerae bacterium]|nr:sodium:proton antiporter [Phycisphaerae bacterium]
MELTAYQGIGIIITVTALVSFINKRFFGLHPTIGVMLAGLAVALVLMIAGYFDPRFPATATKWMQGLQFNELVLNCMLGFLLFSGSLHVDLNMLKRRGWPIGVFALAGVVGTAFIIAFVLHALSNVFGLGLSFLHCLLFGALISPTDPIAVLAILRQVGAPKDLEIDISGESLFNDGIGVVMFLVVVRLITGQGVSVPSVMGLFVVEAAGGIGLGVVYGYLGSRLIRQAGEARVGVLITLAIASGGFLLANALHTSGALAMVVAGVLVGNHENWLNRHARKELDDFWEVVDEVGNAILFVLVGLEVLVVSGELRPEWWKCVLGGSLAIPIVLLARAGSLVVPLSLLRLRWKFHHNTLAILTWGGLRGGLPFAMALCIPSISDQIQRFHVTRDRVLDRALVLTMTYSVVAFSIIVQGLTIKPLIRRAMAFEAGRK